MRLSDGIIPDDAFRARVDALCERFGPLRAHVAPGWQSLADQLHLGRFAADDPPVDEAGPAVGPGATRGELPTVLIGPPAFVLAHAREAEAAFGFVTPDARTARPWQRATTWRDDTTLRLWDLGWSILTIDRLVVATHSASFEFVIADVRRTPATATPGAI